jgi:predicted transcriptional regulator of viral defense system
MIKHGNATNNYVFIFLQQTNNNNLVYHIMTLSSVYAQKMAMAANSPRKHSALKNFVPSVVHAPDPTMQHPAKKWLKSS